MSESAETRPGSDLAAPGGTSPAAAPPTATLPPPPTSIPWLGLLAVLSGTFISTLNTRLSTLGLADIRGAVHAGFDEGAWIPTAQTVAQMLDYARGRSGSVPFLAPAGC